MEQDLPQKKEKIVGGAFLKKVAKRLQGTSSENPKNPESQAEEFKKKAEAVRAQYEYISTVDQLANPESVQKLREMREQELIEQAKTAQRLAEEAAERERQRLEKEKSEAEQAAIAEQQKREQIEKELQAQRDRLLLEKLEQLEKSRKPLQEQLSEYLAFVDTISDRLGLPKLGDRTQAPASDPHIALEIEKLRIGDAQRQREFELKMAQDKKEWDLKLLQFQREAEWKAKEMEMQAKRDQQWFSIPEVVGSAIGKALKDRAAVSEAPASYHIEAPVAVEGSVNCPVCQKPVGFGPTQTSAQCVGCNTRFNVVRTSPPPSPPPTSSEPTSPVNPPVEDEEE